MQTIYLDISNKGVVPTVYAKQGDVGRKFLVVLTDSGIPYSLPAGSVFSVWYEGDSGEGNYTDIGEQSAFSINENAVTVEMIEQMLSVAGNGILCLTLNKADGGQIGSWNIPYVCECIPGFESEEATSYYTAFSETVKNLQKMVETDPTVPAWAKQPQKPAYTAEEVGARPNTWMPTVSDIGAMPVRPNVATQPKTADWHRVGFVKCYSCCRLTISTIYATKHDMGAIVDIAATYSNPVLIKAAAAFTSSSVKVIDQVRLVKDGGKYYVDIHYTQTVANDVYVRLDGPENSWTTYPEWPVVSSSETAAVTLAL